MKAYVKKIDGFHTRRYCELLNIKYTACVFETIRIDCRHNFSLSLSLSLSLSPLKVLSSVLRLTPPVPERDYQVHV